MKGRETREKQKEKEIDDRLGSVDEIVTRAASPLKHVLCVLPKLFDSTLRFLRRVSRCVLS